MKDKNHHIKIDVINKYYLPVTAGIETNLNEVYSYLAKKGNKITIHTSRNTLTKKNVLPRYERINNIEVNRYDYRWYSFIPKIDWKNTNVISLHNFDILPHLFILFYCLLLKLTSRKKFVLILTPHSGFNPNWEDFPKAERFLKYFYHYTLGKVLINLTVDKIRAISEWERQEMINKGLKSSLIKIIGDGLEKEAFLTSENNVNENFKKKIRDFQPYLIQIGRIHPIKNYEATIKAMTGIPKKVKFVIVGPDQNSNYKTKLKSLIKELGLEKRVIFLGEVTNWEKYYALKNAQLMVHMAKHGGFCNAVFEGMSQGLVCIVSNRTALPYLVKNNVNGYNMNPNFIRKLTKKINDVLKNKKNAAIQKIEKENKKITENATWDVIAKRVEAFYLNKAISLNEK